MKLPDWLTGRAKPRPTPEPSGPVFDMNLMAQWIRESHDAYVKLLGRPLLGEPQDPGGVAQAIVHRQTKDALGFEAWLMESEEYKLKHPPAPDPVPIPDPTPAPGFRRKTRDEVKAVETNFLNLRDSTGRPQFTAFIPGMPKPRQDEWIQNELKAGSTHLVLAFDSNGYGVGDPPDLQRCNLYTEGRGRDMRELVERVMGWQLTPVIFLHSGDTYAGPDYYRGICRWWNDQAADLTDQVVFVCGWETRRFGGHRAWQFDEANTIMRQVLGDRAILAFHGSPESGLFGSHAPVEDRDPWADDDEPSNWFTHCGKEFETFLFQTLYADDSQLDDFGQPKWWNRAVDTAERFLPAGTPMPGTVGMKDGQHDGGWHYRNGYAGPDWFGGRRERGRPVLVAFEYVAWGYIRDLVSEQRVKDVAGKLASFGFQHFGNGRP